MSSARPRRRILVGVTSVAAGVVLLAGCSSAAGADSGTPAPGAATTPTARAGSPASGGSATSAAGSGSGPVPAQVARTAASERVRFRPERLSLPGGAAAPVDPAATVDRVLAVPDDIQRVGWWDGSAWAGEPFGSTVVAGHLDAPGQGQGFFEQLRRLRPGDVVTLTGSGHRAAYRVTTTRAVPKASIDSGSAIFDQRGEHRLVLITCAGHFDRATRSYDENLVVTALPLGPAR